MVEQAQRPLRVAIVGSGPSAMYAAEALFATLRDHEHAVEWSPSVRVSWHQICDDELQDLLATAGGKAGGNDLQMRDDPRVGVTVRAGVRSLPRHGRPGTGHRRVNRTLHARGNSGRIHPGM